MSIPGSSSIDDGTCIDAQIAPGLHIQGLCPLHPHRISHKAFDPYVVGDGSTPARRAPQKGEHQPFHVGYLRVKPERTPGQ